MHQFFLTVTSLVELLMESEKKDTNIFLCQSNNWEVMNDLGQMDMSSVPGSTLDLSIPGICEGYLMKRRKYPLKGWHKVSAL